MNTQIIAKVQDLLALSKNNDNLSESAAAYKAAQKLLTKYKLSIADIQSAPTSQREVIKTHTKPLYSGKRKIGWKGILARGIAEENGCGVYWTQVYRSSWVNELVVVGRESDYEIVQYLYSIVSTQIEDLCKAAMIINRGKGKIFANNFKLGATKTVINRLQEANKEIEVEYQGSTALVLLKKDKQEIEKAMQCLNLKTVKYTSKFSNDGYSAGLKAGKNIDLSRGKLGGFLT